jgi:tetratricopeptide (TPR) repeat protein
MESPALMERASAEQDMTGSSAGQAAGAAVERTRCGPSSEQRPDAACASGAGRASAESLARDILTPEDPLPAALAYHTAALAAGALAQAESVFAAALKRHPHNRRLQFLRIDLLLRQEKFPQAMDAIEAAMAEFGVDDGILAAALAVRGRIGPRGTTPADRDVSLCMIVKDEQRHLAACLQSVKGLVDEIVVADTGSADRSRDIATAFGARVIEVPWEADFARARNAALAAASRRWVLVLDADEVISARDREPFEALLRGAGTEAVAYTLRTRNYSFHASTVGWQTNDGAYPNEERGLGWFPSDKVRLFPRVAGVRFSFPVHELVEPSLRELGIPIRECGVAVHHYGKLEAAKTLEKTRDYRKLGQKKLGSAPFDAAAIREAAIQSSHLGRHAEAAQLWQRYLEKEPRSAEAHLNLGSACWQLGRYAEALDHAKSAGRLNSTLKEAVFNRAIAELLLGRAPAASRAIERLVNRHPDYLPARFILAAAHACSGKTRQSLAALQPLQATALGPHLAESFLDLARRLLSAPHAEYCAKLLRAAVAANCADDRILRLLETVDPESELQRKKAMRSSA